MAKDQARIPGAGMDLGRASNDPDPDPGQLYGFSLRRLPLRIKIESALRREYLDQTLFWTTADLEQKLRLFQEYFNRQRVHSGLGGRLPDPEAARTPIDFASYHWQHHCRGLYQTPIAA